MGRKANPIVLEYFERGPKLNDSSNRYPHKCKLCGANFPKGRNEQLIAHLTKKCPAMSEGDRVNVILTLNGITRMPKNLTQSNGQPVDLPVIQRNWTALETLAEVSRQIDLNDKHDDRPADGTAPPNGAESDANKHAIERFELQDAFTLTNQPTATNQSPAQQRKPDVQMTVSEDLLTEERLQALIQSASSPSDAANLSMAAAATARLNPSLLDPQLRAEQSSPATAVAPVPDMAEGMAEPAPATPTSSAAQPWGELTYLQDGLPTAANPGLVEPAPAPATSTPDLPDLHAYRPGGPNGVKSRHSRARFGAVRRKEVQEVRKIGACIRCRILRKNCSKGDPCDTCRKVLSPRIWLSGCVRTKFSQQLDIFSAGVQIVLAQHRITNLKAAIDLIKEGALVEATLFPELDVSISLEVYQSGGPKNPDGQVDIPEHNPWARGAVVMLDSDKEDVPAKLEVYMRSTMLELVRREPSHFAKTTLETALALSGETNDALLRMAIELWGLIEILDRERQWKIGIRPTAEGDEPRFITEEMDQEVYTTICLQFTAAAERKAGATSKALLTGMQRLLQDAKTKLDHCMFFTMLILLHCVEKTTWAFKAWEQETLRAMWPLEKQPANYTGQGYVLADLLRMLLGIRKVLPGTSRNADNGLLVTTDQNPVIQGYFQALNLNCKS